jgi:hypothetical protein
MSKHIIQTPFLNTLNIRASLKLSDQRSHPQKTAGKDTVLCILILLHCKISIFRRKKGTQNIWNILNEDTISSPKIMLPNLSKYLWRSNIHKYLKHKILSVAADM